jgi:hypothetical protein
MPYALFVQLLLLMLTVAASPTPIIYIGRHLARSPAHYNAEGLNYDFAWRTPRNLKLNIAVLAGLAIAGVVIYRELPPGIITPIMALSFVIMAPFVAWSIHSVVTGLQTGRITAITRGVHFKAERAISARHFWLVVGWNAFVGLLWLLPLPVAYAFILPTFPRLN